MKLDQLIPDLIEITKEACSAIMEVYSDFQTGDVLIKEDNSPLTIADKRSHEIILQGLTQITPNWPVISEEHKNLEYAKRKDAEYIWCVDPLDGTKEFIKQNGEFTTNIALIHRQSPVIGVIGVPADGRVAYAYRGGGATLIQGMERQKLHANNFKLNTAGLRLVASRSHMNDATKTFVSRFDSPKTVAKGSSLKFLSIAAQEADIYPRLAPTMEWDTAAAHCILEQAGGIILRHDNHEPLRYNKADLLNPYFIAFGDVQDDLMAWMSGS